MDLLTGVVHAIHAEEDNGRWESKGTLNNWACIKCGYIQPHTPPCGAIHPTDDALSCKFKECHEGDHEWHDIFDSPVGKALLEAIFGKKNKCYK